MGTGGTAGTEAGGSGGQAGNDTPAVELADLAGVYDLAFGERIVEADTITWCDAAWARARAQLEIREEGDGAVAIVVPEWGEAATSTELWLDADGNLHVGFDRATQGAALTRHWGDGVSVGNAAQYNVFNNNWSHDTLAELMLRVVDRDLYGTGTAHITSSCYDCDAGDWADYSTPVAVSADVTPPRVRTPALDGSPWDAVLEYVPLADTAPMGAILPFEPLVLEFSEPVDVAQVVETIELWDTESVGGEPSAISFTNDDPPAVVFDDWDAVAGTTQWLMLSEPMVDASGNASDLEQQVLPVLDVGAPLANHDFADPGSVAVWGNTTFLATDTTTAGLCLNAGCLALGPVLDPELGFAAVAGRVLTDGATLLRVRVRVFGEFPAYDGDEWGWEMPTIELKLHSRTGQVQQIDLGQSLPDPTAWSDPEYDWIVFATDWTWVEIPVDGAEPELGFVLQNELVNTNYYWCERLGARVVIDEMVAE